MIDLNQTAIGNLEIGQYFKQEPNKDKTTAQILAQMILGGAIAAVTGSGVA